MPSELDELERVVRPLESEPNVVAACLIGSYARKSSQPDRFSDIDLVAIVKDGLSEKTRRALVHNARSRDHNVRHVELRTLRSSTLFELIEKRTVYGAHLAREAHVLFDTQGVFAHFRATFPLAEPIAETAEPLRLRLSLYEHLDWCNGRYLFCLADLYAIGRSGAMLGLAQRGVFEFDRHRVFCRFADCYPSGRQDVLTLSALEPFYMLVRRKANDRLTLPFSPADCHIEAITARNACNALLTRLK